MAPPSAVVSIADLSLKTPKTCTILGKVVKRFVLTSYNRGGKQYHYVIFRLRDQSVKDGYIKVTLFGSAALKANQFLVENVAVRIRNFYISVDEGINVVMSHKENSYGLRTEITRIVDPQILAELDFQTYDPIADIENYGPDKTAAVLGIVSSVRDWKTIQRNGSDKQEQLREIFIYDASKAEVKVTLWGQRGVEFSSPVGTVVAITKAQVKHFKGINLAVGYNSTFEIKPNGKASQELQKWNRSRDKTQILKKLSEVDQTPVPCGSLKRVIDETAPARKRFFSATVRVGKINGSAEGFFVTFYKGCTKLGCNKTVTPENSQFYCPNCKRCYPQHKMNMCLSVQLADRSATVVTTLFSSELEEVLPFSINALFLMYQYDRALFGLVLDQYLMEKDFFVSLKVVQEDDCVKWEVRRIKAVEGHPNPLDSPTSDPGQTPETAAEFPVSPTQLDGTQMETEIESEFSRYLGPIEEIDAVPSSWREEQ